MHYLNHKEAKELYKAFLSLGTEDECKKFIGDLLTPSEIQEFSKRWQVARMLDAKVPYEEIIRVTGMSSTTIARISKWFNGGTGGYRLILDKMKK
jgi:TrpR-related protein YerC/YecD